MDEPPGTTAELAQLLGQSRAPLGRSLLLLSEALQQTPGVASKGSTSLDRLAEEVSSKASGPPELDDLVRTIFVDYDFAGDVENYHDEQNSFLDRVIERRLGMPITLSALVVAVGLRVDIALSLIGLPGHVVVGKRDSNDQFESFVDAFSGSQVDRAGLDQRLRSIFGRDVKISDDMLVPMSTISVVARVLNNLTRTWAGEPSKFDRLLEVRSQIPQSETDRRTLADMAEARGRFDIAANVRQSIDPGDPTINALWAKLN